MIGTQLPRKPSLLLGNGDTTNCINHAQIQYVWEIKHETRGCVVPEGECFIPIGHDVCNIYDMSIHLHRGCAFHNTVSGTALVAAKC